MKASGDCANNFFQVSAAFSLLTCTDLVRLRQVLLYVHFAGCGCRYTLASFDLVRLR
jgi:hypothetical protein